MKGPRIVKTALLTGALAAGCMAASPAVLYANQDATATQNGGAVAESNQSGAPVEEGTSTPAEQAPESEKTPVQPEPSVTPDAPGAVETPAAPTVPIKPAVPANPAAPSAPAVQPETVPVQGVTPLASAESGDPVPGAAMLRTAMNVKPAAGDVDEVLGTFAQLFPSESFREMLRKIGCSGWADDKEVTRSELRGAVAVFMTQSAGFVMGKKDAESLAHLNPILSDFHVMGNHTPSDNPPKSWIIEDMDAFWNSISKWDNISSFSMLYPEYRNGANKSLNLNIPKLADVKLIQLSGWSRSANIANPITKVFDGSHLTGANLPALTNLRFEDVALDDWSAVGTINTMKSLIATTCDIKDVSFVQGLTNLTELNLYGNAILDFSPLKPILDLGKITAPGLSGQNRYMAGDEGFTMWGDMDELVIPLEVVSTDGTKMGADKFTGVKVEGKKLVSLPAGQLPDGIRYDEAAHSFILTREAAKALPRVKPSCLGYEANMFIVQFTCPIPGFTDASGKAWIEVNVTDAVQAKPVNQVPVINASDVTITEGETFDPMAGVTATDNEDGEVEVKLESSDVDATKPGTYTVTYVASDSTGATVRKTITVTVKAAPKPEEKRSPSPSRLRLRSRPTSPRPSPPRSRCFPPRATSPRCWLHPPVPRALRPSWPRSSSAVTSSV